jgi:hypothetical protein
MKGKTLTVRIYGIAADWLRAKAKVCRRSASQEATAQIEQSMSRDELGRKAK